MASWGWGGGGGGLCGLFILVVLISFFLASHRISQFHNTVGLVRLGIAHSFVVLFRILYLEIGI